MINSYCGYVGGANSAIVVEMAKNANTPQWAISRKKRNISSWWAKKNDKACKKMKPQEFTPLLHSICEKIETITGQEFNSVLVNLYRDGQDSNGWHSDDEKELGVAHFIASLSLGETRDIQFKHKS